jgi:ABC-type Mn2+/Zn2+ transport system permease subunit
VDLFRDILVFLHLVGYASLFGGAFVQLRDRVKVVNHAMLDGALVQVVSGLLLVGVIEGMDDPLNRTKIGVKLAVGLVVALLCWVNRAKERVPSGLFNGIMLLTLLNVGIAVFW